MKNQNCMIVSKHKGVSRIPVVVMFIVFALSICGLPGTSANKVVKQAGSSMAEQCRIDLAKRLKVNVSETKVIKMKTVTWSDAALGMPQIGGMYGQMMTPGSAIILKCRNSQYLYTASAKAFKYGGSTDSWACSLLYTKPVSNEPNLNGDLYQCSLLGTNSIRVASGVSDYYPSDKGMIIIRRRTSRSGHELLYVKADGKGKVKPLYSAFDFGEAAFNDTQDQWAGFVRPALGDVWSVVIGRIGKEDTDAQILPLPGGVTPISIAWSGARVLILTGKNEQSFCFETTPKSTSAEWKNADTQSFPGTMDYALNKSETLEISQITKNGKWSVEVARVWFTGDRKLLATIDDFTLRGNKLLGGRFAYIWGEKDSKPAICTVDIATGEVLTFPGGVNGVKPFRYPLRSSPMVLLKGK